MCGNEREREKENLHNAKRTVIIGVESAPAGCWIECIYEAHSNFKGKQSLDTSFYSLNTCRSQIVERILSTSE